MSEHQIVIDAALRTNEELARLFARLGNTDAPNGKVLSAYRMARRALRGDVNNLPMLLATLMELRERVRDVVGEVLADAVDVGMMQAARELKAYGLGAGMSNPADPRAATDAILSALDAQVTRVKALAINGIQDEALVLGDEERVGILSPTPVISEASKWTGALAVAAWMANIEHATRGSGDEFHRQAIAAIDERTTDCCLRVHGQVVGLQEDFHLTGTRFADYLRNPPFHWW